MKQHFLKVTALCALMLSAVAVFAQIPEHVYLVGEASPSLWFIDEAVEMTNEGDGVFTYHGVLYKQKLQFITERNWDAVRYVPEVGGWHLKDANTATMIAVVGSENSFWVPDVATYDITLTISNGGQTIKAEAAIVGDPAPQVVLMGAASGQWDTASPRTSANIYPADEEKPDVFIWEGVPAAHEECKHIKFIDYPCNWWETTFYVPESVNYNGNVQLVKDGNELSVAKRRNGEGELDHFWGFASEDCDGSTYRVTLDITNLKIKFENISTPVTGTGVQTPDAATVKAFFAGDRLVVDGAVSAIEVYNMAGKRLAYSEKGTLVMSGLSSGVYIVKSGAFVQKICK